MNDFELINYIIDNHTIMEAVVHFDCSRTTIMKRLREFRKDPLGNQTLKEKLKLALLRNSLRGRKRGGTISRKEPILTDEEAEMLKLKKTNEGLSYRQLEALTGIPYSTIRNAIEKLNENYEHRSR